MKQHLRLYVGLIMMLVSFTFYGQLVNTYSFGTNTTGILDAMTGSTQLVGPNQDDGVSSVTNIGFTFNYAGINYTQFSVNSNGNLRLGATAVTNQWTNSASNAGSTSPVIMSYWDDLATGSNGKVHYLLTGVSPNRVLKVEWNVTVPRSVSGPAGAKFQCWLYETSNNIDIIYGAGMVSNTANSGASIGLATSSTVFNTVNVTTNTNSTSTFTTTNTAAIISGRIYTFIPPPPPACPIPNSIVITATSPTTATVSWSGASSAIVEWGASGCTAGLGATAGACGNVLSGSSPQTITGLTFGSSYSVYVRQDCTGSGNGFSSNVNNTYTHTAGESCFLAETLTVFPNLSSSVNTLLTTGLTSDGPPGTCSDGTGNPSKKDKWVKFVAPSSGNKVIITTSSGTITDAVMQVWSSCPATGVALGCSDDVNGFMPELEFCSLIPGNTYYVQSWPYSATSTGNYNIKIYEATPCPVPPPNDECSGVVTLSINPANSCPSSATVGTTVNSTATSGVPKTNCDAFGTYNDVFYKFNSGAFTDVHLEFTNISGTNEFGIYSGCGTTYLGVCSSSSFTNNITGLLPNTDYSIVVWANSAAVSGNFSLCLSCIEKTWYSDSDGDGFGNSDVTAVNCIQPIGFVSNNLDCDDTNAMINPNTNWYRDFDGDLFGDLASQPTISCFQPEGYVTNNTDCNDEDPNVNPSIQETCNYIDDNCDGTIDEGVKSTFYADTDNDGFGDINADSLDCTTPIGYVTNDDDCNDNNINVNPSVSEQCNDIDDNCSGFVDEGCGCTNPLAHNYDPLATLNDGSCETCTDGIKNGSEVDVDCGGNNPNCPTCPPPTAVCGNIVTITVTPADLKYNGPGTSDVYYVPAVAFDGGSTIHGLSFNREVQRKFTNVAFDWTTNGAELPTTPPNAIYNNNDKGLVYKPFMPVTPVDFNKIRNFDMRITDQFGVSTCEGRYKIVYSSGGSNPIVIDENIHTQIASDDSEFGIYPNPGINQVFVKLSYVENNDYTISVFDLVGKEVIKLDKVDSSIMTLDTEHLGAGAYTIIINGLGQTKTMKWIKIQ